MKILFMKGFVKYFYSAEARYQPKNNCFIGIVPLELNLVTSSAVRGDVSHYKAVISRSWLQNRIELVSAGKNMDNKNKKQKDKGICNSQR